MSDLVPINCPEDGTPLRHLDPVVKEDGLGTGADLPTEFSHERYQCPYCQTFYRLEDGRLLKNS